MVRSGVQQNHEFVITFNWRTVHHFNEIINSTLLALLSGKDRKFRTGRSSSFWTTYWIRLKLLFRHCCNFIYNVLQKCSRFSYRFFSMFEFESKHVTWWLWLHINICLWGRIVTFALKIIFSLFNSNREFFSWFLSDTSLIDIFGS